MYRYIFLMFVHRYFFEECSYFDNFIFIIGKISASWWSHSKNFLNSHVVHLSVCLFNILFGYNLGKNRTKPRKLWYVFEVHRFALHMKNCYFIVHKSFYRALQKFQNMNIFCSFLMTEIGTKFLYVFKLHRSDLQTKICHRI